MILWHPVAVAPEPMIRLLVWRDGEAFTAYHNGHGEWCTDPEPASHPIDGRTYPFLSRVEDCGITHWAYIEGPEG